MSKKKIEDVLKDKNGVTKAVKFKDNKTYTELNVAIKLTEEGKVKDTHVATSSKGNKYLRSNPNKSKQDNLDNL